MKALIRLSGLLSIALLSFISVAEQTVEDSDWQKIISHTSQGAQKMTEGKYQESLLNYLTSLELLDEMALRKPFWNPEKIQKQRFECLQQAHKVMEEQILIEEGVCQKIWIEAVKYRKMAEASAEAQTWLEAEKLYLKELENLEILRARNHGWNTQLVLFQREECLRCLRFLGTLIRNEKEKSLVDFSSITREGAIQRIIQLEEIVRYQNQTVEDSKQVRLKYEQQLQKMKLVEDKKSLEAVRLEITDLLKQNADLVRQKEEVSRKITWWQEKYNQLVESQLNNTRSVASLTYELAIARALIAETKTLLQDQQVKLQVQAQLIQKPTQKIGLAYEYYQELLSERAEKQELMQEVEVLRRSRPVDLKDRELIKENENLLQQNYALKQQGKKQEQQNCDLSKKNQELLNNIKTLEEELKQLKEKQPKAEGHEAK